MSTGLSKYNGVSGGRGHLINALGNVFLMFAYTPVFGQCNVGLVTPWHTGKATITGIHIIQFEPNCHQPIKKSAVAVAVVALPTVSCSDEIIRTTCPLATAVQIQLGPALSVIDVEIVVIQSIVNAE